MSTPLVLDAHRLAIEAPGGRALFKDLTIMLGRESAAVVGRNGVGKSTLLEVLAGEAPPREGRLSCPGRTILVRQDLTAELPPAASPGEYRRQRLEAAFHAAPDLLLLDEPTLDLDAAGIAWLGEQIRCWPGGLLVVSHEPAVLRAFHQFLVVEESGCRCFQGTFQELQAHLGLLRDGAQDRYRRELVRLAAQEQHNETVRRRRQRKKNLGRIRELKRCPERFKLNDKRSYKQESQGKRAVLQKVRIGAAREEVRAARRALPVTLALEMALPKLPNPRGPPIIRCDAAAATVGGRTLFEGLSLSLGRERLAVCGPNGSGKTTLLEVALGLRLPTAGSARADMSHVGYIAQNATNWCMQECLTQILATRSTAVEVTAVLAAHRFPPALAGRPLDTLSPGERVRAALICLTRREPAPEILVLDEPTQHLDFEGRAALETVLAAWPGGLLVVSHDPEFLQAIRVVDCIEL